VVQGLYIINYFWGPWTRPQHCSAK